jgi:hypothetical protein
MGGRGEQFSSGFDPFSSFSTEFFRQFSGSPFTGFSMPVVYQLDLSLEDLFTGKKVVVPAYQDKINLNIEPGMSGGTEMIVRGVSQGSGRGTRDLIFRLHELSHPTYMRQNHDLLVELRISILEALFGFKRNITQLDGSSLLIQSPSNAVIQPTDVFALDGHGMPVFRQHGKRGRLFVKIKLELPTRTILHRSHMGGGYRVRRKIVERFKRLCKVVLDDVADKSLIDLEAELSEDGGEGGVFESMIGQNKSQTIDSDSVETDKTHVYVTLQKSDLRLFGANQRGRGISQDHPFGSGSRHREEEESGEQYNGGDDERMFERFFFR